MKNSVLNKYISKQKWLLLISGIFSVLSTCAIFVPFISVYHVIAQLLQEVRDYESMKMWGIIAFVSLLVGLVLLAISGICSHTAAFDILYQMRVDIMNHLSKLPMGFHTEHSSGTIVKMVEQSVEKVENFVAHQIPDVVAAIVFPIIYIVIMMVIDYRLGIASLIPIVLAVGAMGKMSGDIVKSGYVKQYHDSLEEMSSNGVEYIRAMPAVKIFNLRVESFTRFFTAIKDYRNFVYHWSLSYRNAYTLFNTTLLGIFLFVMPLGGYLVLNNPQSLSLALTVLMFFILIPGLSTPVIKLMYTVSSLNNIFEGVERIDTIFNTKPLVESSERKVLQGHEIVMENISFSYQEETQVLKDITLTIPENKVTALVGPSGGGKSTLASLLLRFYDVTQGDIKIGGISIKDMPTSQLMETVSFVFQDVYLFQDTIEENIRMGNTKATTADIERVAKMARCHSFIEELPDKYKTRIGDKGVFLSKGEAQRISIARALLKNAPILILDEATAYADAENELHIQQAISELIKEKTVLIVAHRLWTIQKAHQIVVIDQGVVTERGTHQQLLSKQGIYAHLWSINTKSKDWKVKEVQNA